MEDGFCSGGEIDRVIYIWARYGGKRHSVHGKVYLKSDVEELIRRLNKYKNNKDSFNDGFEKDDVISEKIE